MEIKTKSGKEISVNIDNILCCYLSEKVLSDVCDDLVEYFANYDIATYSGWHTLSDYSAEKSIDIDYIIDENLTLTAFYVTHKNHSDKTKEIAGNADAFNHYKKGFTIVVNLRNLD